MFLWPRGLLRARSRFPEIVENTESVVEGMERLDGAVELAKQVLSQLSYTPTVGVLILRHFSDLFTWLCWIDAWMQLRSSDK